MHTIVGQGSNLIELASQVERELKDAKVAYTVRRVARDAMATILRGDRHPQPGDLVLAQVRRLGQHKRIELADGRRAHLFVGDKVVVSYGNRYAPDQFEAVVPDNLGECHLVAAGGIAAVVLARDRRMKRPTVISPLGLLGDKDRRPLNIAHWAIGEVVDHAVRPYTIAVVGTSMGAGKTTTAASLIRGLNTSGLKVGAAKVTGTGAGPDTWFMLDAGAAPALDFTDAGFASTYRLPLNKVAGILTCLTAHLTRAGVQRIVVELADGLFQRETAHLLALPEFAEAVDGIIVAARDAMGAVAAVDWLRRKRLPVFALSGLLTTSPLAAREAADATGLPVLSDKALCEGSWRPDRSFESLRRSKIDSSTSISALSA